MIANVKEFEKKLIDNDLNRKLLAKEMHISPTTLTTKLEKEEGDFKLSEMIAIAQITKMNEREFILIFLEKNFLLTKILKIFLFYNKVG